MGNKSYHEEIHNPKISIISSIYNKEKFILRFIRSIQNQSFKDFEIILVDDFSKDDSVNIIKNLQKEDKRIKLILNKENKGTLISRNEGIFFSRGKYLIFPDGDDILSNDIINQCFLIAKEKNYDMIRFNTYIGNRIISQYNIIKYQVNKTIYKPNLSSYIFYGSGHLEIIDPMISNKFVKRNIVINALNSIGSYYLEQKMTFYEDTLINYMLYQTANSFYHLKYLGYYYIQNPSGTTGSYYESNNKINQLLFSFFLFLNFIFNCTKNNKFEKDMVNSIIEKEMDIILTNSLINKINKKCNYYEKEINEYAENDFISLKIKKRFNVIKQKIKDNMKQCIH